MSLWSLNNDGLGTQANPDEVYDCSDAESDAIRYFLGRTKSPDLTRLSQAISKQIEYFSGPSPDPYGIHNAVATALNCVQSAIDEANKY